MTTPPTTPSGRSPLGQAIAALPHLLTPRETADRLKLSVSWLARRRLEGDGPAYMKVGRPVRYQEPALLQWGNAMSYSAVERAVTETTRSTLGAPISPHLFRTAGATTSATYATNTPHLASALLHHSDPRVTEQHYNRATSLSAALSYSEIVERYRLANAGQ